jgi:N-hydroxyarylamine O-acetyltransferase
MSPVWLEPVLERLGFGSPPRPDRAGLEALYRAWCLRVPFDNVRKMTALRTSPQAPLPGITSHDFFAHWLAHGTGGTCWPSSNAMFDLLRALGFAAQRVVGSMRDQGLVNHGSVKVAREGRMWLVDTSMLTNVPLPLGDSVWDNRDPIWPAEVEPTDGTHLIWTQTPPYEGYLPCRLLNDEANHAFYAARYELSRERSPFNQRVYARRNYPGRFVVISGNTRHVRTEAGTIRQELSPEALCAALVEEIGLSAECIRAWADSGALADSFAPPSGPKPPPLLAVPPSQRTPMPR